MINPPTPSFFAIHISGEAADLVTNKLSPSTTADIREAVLISEDYENDIHAQHEMDLAVEKLREELNDSTVTVEEQFNPLYYPATPERIESMMETDATSDNFKFTGFEGNPFTMKSVDLIRDSEKIISARVACHQFELPSLSEIIESHNVRLN